MILAFLLHIALSLMVGFVFIQKIQGIPENVFTLFAAFMTAHTFFWLLSFLIYRRYFVKLPYIIDLILYFFKEFLMANLKLTYEIVSPVNNLEPAVIALPLEVKSDLEILLLSNLITLTPGTLTLDIAEDKKTLFVHAIFVKEMDKAKVQDNLKNGFERKILKITR